MMLTPWNIPCDANTLRGQLKHSWLENEVLCISIEAAIARWRQGRGDLAARYLLRVQGLSRLTESLVEGFSPEQLVDTLKPFGGLSEEERTAIKAAVHAAYLENSSILALRTQLKAAAMDMEVALQELSRAWVLPQSQGEGAVRDAWEGVRKKAHTLIIELERLPKGVVLP